MTCEAFSLACAYQRAYIFQQYLFGLLAFKLLNGCGKQTLILLAWVFEYFQCWQTTRTALDHFQVSRPTLKAMRERGEVEFIQLGREYRYNICISA